MVDEENVNLGAITTGRVVDGLHMYFCEETPHDLHHMRTALAKDPQALERISITRIFDNGEEVRLTPLLIAAECGHVKCVELLLAAGANPRPVGTNGIDVFVQALVNDCYDILEYLLAHNVIGPRFQPARSGYLSDTTQYLHVAASQKNPKTIQFLLDAGLPTEDLHYLNLTQSGSNLTPAITAVKFEKPTNLKCLLLNGALVDFERDVQMKVATDRMIDSLSLPLQFVLSYYNDLDAKCEILDLLYDFGANFHKNSRMGPSVLEILQSDYLRREARHILRLTDLCAQGTEDFSLVSRLVVANRLRNKLSAPMSLKGICRLVIRKVLGTRYLKDVEKLGSDLPREVSQYLMFQ